METAFVGMPDEAEDHPPDVLAAWVADGFAGHGLKSLEVRRMPGQA